MGKWLERVIEKRDSREKKSCDITKTDTDKTDTMAVPAKSVEGGLDFIDHLTETEREYYFNLVEFMESPKYRMDRGTAEKEAWTIITEYRLRKEQRKK